MANTIAEKLTYLSGTKDAIKQAIIGKGVDVSDTDTFRSYANKISSIQAGGSIADAPSGMKFAHSTFTTVPDFIIPYLETQTNMDNMFYNCYFLETVPHFDTSKATTMNFMFGSCYILKSIPLFNTSNITSMNYAFFNTSLQTMTQLDTSKCTDVSYMFNYCTKLQSVPLLNVSNVINADFVFDGCTSLTNLGGLTGLKLDLDLSSSPKLTVDSVINVINAAADMTSEPKTLSLHQDVFNKLSQEQIATASAKGWNIAAK